MPSRRYPLKDPTNAPTRVALPIVEAEEADFPSGPSAIIAWPNYQFCSALEPHFDSPPAYTRIARLQD